VGEEKQRGHTPEGLHERLYTSPPSPYNTPLLSPVGDQILIVPSPDAEAILSKVGDVAQSHTREVWPVRTCCTTPVAVFDTRSVASLIISFLPSYLSSDRL
jgi:hypothetical protein